MRVLWKARFATFSVNCMYEKKPLGIENQRREDKR